LGHELGDIDADAFLGEVVVVFADVVASAAAVAGDERGAALGEVASRAAILFGEDSAVAVVMEVDEAGGDDEAFAVDGFFGGQRGDVADCDDAVARDCDRANVGRVAAAVDDRAIGEQEIDLGGRIGERGRRDYWEERGTSDDPKFKS